jgi:hypothetical protein
VNLSDPLNSLLSSQFNKPGSQNSGFVASNYGPGSSSTGGLSPRDHFLHQITQVWDTAIPMSTQWIVYIDSFPKALRTSIIQGLERTDGDKSGFDIDQAVSVLTNNDNQQIMGCLFANEVTIPTEEYAVETATVNNNRGFLPGVLGSNRNISAPSLNISFKETNTSFMDFVIRPWVILAAHYGLVARPGDQGSQKDPKNVKVTLRVLEYTRTQPGVSMIPRKTWTFFNCVPYNVSEQSLDYEQEKLQTFRTLWTYSNYTVSTNSFISVGSLLDGPGNASMPGTVIG